MSLKQHLIKFIEGIIELFTPSQKPSPPGNGLPGPAVNRVLNPRGIIEVNNYYLVTSRFLEFEIGHLNSEKKRRFNDSVKKIVNESSSNHPSDILQKLSQQIPSLGSSPSMLNNLAVLSALNRDQAKAKMYIKKATYELSKLDRTKEFNILEEYIEKNKTRIAMIR